MTYTPPPVEMPRCPGPSMQDILQADGESAPTVLREESFLDLGDQPLSVERYTSRAFHDREVEKMWRKVWQMVGRVEQIPNVGDHIVYEIADDSLIVTRTSEMEIKAYYNACLHRGTRLRDEGGHVQAFRCPFHGFTWGLDGTLKGVPCRWDFPTLKDENFRLPEARVATWGGFVFINMDPQCVPFEEYLGEVGRHFETWPLEQRHLTAHVSKVVHANWKVAQEAFMEAFHVLDTHPEIEAYFGDWNAQYDVYHGGHSRIYNAMYVPSPRMTQYRQGDSRARPRGHECSALGAQWDGGGSRRHDRSAGAGSAVSSHARKQDEHGFIRLHDIGDARPDPVFCLP